MDLWSDTTDQTRFYLQQQIVWAKLTIYLHVKFAPKTLLCRLRNKNTNVPHVVTACGKSDVTLHTAAARAARWPQTPLTADWLRDEAAQPSAADTQEVNNLELNYLVTSTYSNTIIGDLT